MVAATPRQVSVVRYLDQTKSYELRIRASIAIESDFAEIVTIWRKLPHHRKIPELIRIMIPHISQTGANELAYRLNSYS